MLEIKDVAKSFDGFMAVARANLEVRQGEIVAVIGPNGAGKTTLFNLITGQLKPDEGQILFQDEDIAGLAPHRICKKGITRSFQVVNIFHRMTVFENVQAAVLAQQGKTLGLFAPATRQAVEETEAILENTGLADKSRLVSGALSHGDQKVLEMAIALGSKPELLILDEPTAGMSPEETAAAIELIKRLNADFGLTVLFCEHDIELVFSISDRIMVMRTGISIIQSTPDTVRQDEHVKKAYLGGS